MLHGRSGTVQNRALRKQLLLLRSDVERAECIEAAVELRDSMTSLRWLKLLLTGASGRGVFKWLEHFNGDLSSLVSHHPLVSSLASLALAKPLRTLLFKTAKPLLKWGAVGLVAWKAYRFWKDATVDDKQAPPRSS